MHPRGEYWGQDVAYGSLVAGEDDARPCGRPPVPAEVWIIDTREGSHGELAALMRRIGVLQGGADRLRQSAARLKEFVQVGQVPAATQAAHVAHAHRLAPPAPDERILGIATLHRTPLLPPGWFAAAAGVPSRAAREQSSAQLCAEFMRHLGALGAGDGVARIDWVMVRASDGSGNARSHLGATRVARLACLPFAPGAATAGSSSAAADPAA